MSPEPLVDALRRAAAQAPTTEAALTGIAAEQAVAHAELEAARARLGALADRRRALESGAVLPALDALQSALRAGLRTDRERLLQRAGVVRLEQARREAQVVEDLRAPELDAALREVERFSTEIEPTLGAMPQGYRRAVLDAHARNLRLLEPAAQALAGGVAGLQLPPVPVAVVASASPAAGRPEALVVVLPVPFEVYARGADRAEDLCTRVAYRLIAAVHGMLADAGATAAPVDWFELHGSLAMQVWLADQAVQVDLRESLLAHVRAAVAGSAEWTDAGVDLHAVWVAPELLAEAEVAR